MYAAIIVLIILVCAVLILAVLIQNPKGGGLSATFGGMGNQVMGAKRSADFIEKATWTLAVSLLVLSLLSGIAMPKTTKKESRKTDLEKNLMETPATPADNQPSSNVPMPDDKNTQPANP
jgi:preprotein translocase subunit SecG